MINFQDSKIGRCHLFARQNLILLIIIIILNFNNSVLSQERVTANFFYHKADSIARTFVTHPRLLRIRSENVDTLGKATGWDYEFLDRGEIVDVHLGLDSVFTDTIMADITGIISVDSGWIDSDSAMAIAEANGGIQYRNEFGEVKIIADLVKGSASPYTEWYIKYFMEGSEYKNFFYIHINALTGEILFNNNIDAKGSYNETEYNFNLFQTYPNPFNASTNVTFSIEKACRATLKIFDIRGIRIDILCDSFFHRGNHNIKWSPESLPSGVYFCCLQTDRTMLTRKLIYSK